MNTRKRYSAEFQERAVRLVEEQQEKGSTQWAAMQMSRDANWNLCLEIHYYA